MTYRGQVAKDGATATINHKAEGFNQKFRSKLQKRIHKEEQFWAKIAGKEIVASGVLDKLINKA